jgi:hypothetical protein
VPGCVAFHLCEEDGQEEEPGGRRKDVLRPFKWGDAAAEQGGGVGGQPGLELKKDDEEASHGGQRLRAFQNPAETPKRILWPRPVSQEVLQA